jgi:ABC-type lipoprotein export system ATPase subunit
MWIRSYQKSRVDDVFIPVMGMTGSGKSTFISTCLGQPSQLAGHGLDSCAYKSVPVAEGRKPRSRP